MRNGIDISYHQGDINFDKVKKDGIDFLIIREGYRKTTDKRFLDYVRKAKDSGIPIFGIYHFSYPINEADPVIEACFCVENVIKAGLSKDTIIFYDFEYDSVKRAKSKGINLGKNECNRYTEAFCEEIKRLGFTPGIYTNLDYYKNWYDPDVLKKYKVWLADYSGNPDFPCLVHQYFNKGKVSGINGNVDLNYLYCEEKTDDKTSKDVKTVVREVIFGLWGNGEERKEKLENAGFNYKDIQNRVNDILNNSYKDAEKTDKKPTSIKASCYAKSKDKNLSGSYLTTSDLYCRDGAGKSKIALCKIPKRTKVQCYGFYTEYNGIKWLLIQFKLNGIQYTGFSSSKYLSKILTKN